MNPAPKPAQALAAVYARIPPVIGCRKGCSDCCGPVPVLPVEVDDVQYAPILNPSPVGTLTPTRLGCGTCMFASTSGCSVYENRPLVCRLFGAVDHPMMTCPHGARAETLLTHEQAMDLVGMLERAAL